MKIRKISSALFGATLLVGCNTVVLEYSEPIIQDESQYHVRNVTDAKTAFLMNAREKEGYYNLKMRFLPIGHPDLPESVSAKAKNPLSPTQACKKKVKDFKKSSISGFAGIYVGDPITEDEIRNSAEIRNSVTLGHYFFTEDPESGAGVYCYVDEQEYRLTSYAPWDLDTISVNIIWLNLKRVETGVDKVSAAIRDAFKSTPLNHVFSLAELTKVDEGLSRLSDIADNYLSDTEIKIKPRNFRINSSNTGWDQQTRKFFELKYLIRDTDNEAVEEERTLGFIELQFEATPSVFAKPSMPKGYPKFSGLKLNDLPKTEVQVGGNSVDLAELILWNKNGLPAYSTSAAVSTFQAKCVTVENALKNNFKLAKIDRSAVLAVFAKESYPEVFASKNNFPSVANLPTPERLTNDEPQDDQIKNQRAKLKQVREKLDEIVAIHNFYSATCLADYLTLMLEMGLEVGANFAALDARKVGVEKLMKNFSMKFPPLTTNQKITQIRSRFSRTFQINESDREVTDFNWIDDSLEVRVLANRPEGLADLGQTKQLTREQFQTRAESLHGQLRCVLNVRVEDAPNDGISRSDKIFKWPNFDMVGIYDDLSFDLFGDETGAQLGNTGFAMVLMRFRDAGVDVLPKVNGMFFLNPEKEHVELIKREVLTYPCRRPIPSDPDERDSGGVLARLGVLMGIDTSISVSHVDDQIIVDQQFTQIQIND